ncbi:uncharacterized protein LOC144437424 [Glandiceps talaboti]
MRNSSMGGSKDGPDDAFAELHRFLSLDDKDNCQIFTFILTNPFDHNYEEIKSRDFTYANNRWRVSLVKAEQQAHLYLSLIEATDGLNCSVDYSFTILHRDDYAKNEIFEEKKCHFTKKVPRHGRRSIVSKDELSHDGYLDENQEFLVELQLRNATTTFECDMEILPNPEASFPRYQSSYFPMGGFDWNVSVYPNGDWTEHEGRVMVNLNRLTQFNHHCRLAYRITIGDEEATKCYTSDVLENTFDFSGQGQGFQLYDDLERYMTGIKLKILVEVLHLAAINQAKIYVFEEQVQKNQVYFIDEDKQTWCIESDVMRKSLRLSLYYIDQYRLPKNYARYVKWDITVLGAAGQRRGALDAPFSEYYIRQDDESGYEMVTDLPVKELADPELRYFPDDGPLRLTVEIEFKISHLLYKANYNKQDDVSRRQIYQLKNQILGQDRSPPIVRQGTSKYITDSPQDSADDSGRGSKLWTSSATSD